MLVGCFYWWDVRSAGDSVVWNSSDLPGYYNYLGRAFASGQLSLSVLPKKELLALANPWDPVQNDPYRMHDMVLFNGRYYLYHGAGPALLIFAPWRFATGHDFPESAAVAAFCCGAYLFYAGALLWVLGRRGLMPGPGVLAMLLLSVGVGNSVPYLCSRVAMYEVAIAGGLFCVAGGICFLCAALVARNSSAWFAACGLLFGLAISCRPHLVFAGGIAAMAIILRAYGRRSGWSAAVAYIIPFVLCGCGVAIYNYVRFGNPFEFGLRYLLAGDVAQQRLRLSWDNLAAGLYYFVLSPPDVNFVFPWFRLAMRIPFGLSDYSFPQGYFIEPIAGAAFVAPFLFALMLPARDDAVKFVRWVVAGSGGAIILFLAATGFSTQRYLVDFVPLLAFGASLTFAAYVASARGTPGMMFGGVISIAIVAAVVVNLALAITGPYDEMLANKPRRFVRIASWFSPVQEFRPILNPYLRLEMDVRFASQAQGFREPLVTIGSQGARHSLIVQHRAADLLLVSYSDARRAEVQSAAIPPAASRIAIEYDPVSRRFRVNVDGGKVLDHPMETLVTAPRQVIVGGNGLPGFINERFTGTINVTQKKVSGGPPGPA